MESSWLPSISRTSVVLGEQDFKFPSKDLPFQEFVDLDDAIRKSDISVGDVEQAGSSAPGDTKEARSADDVEVIISDDDATAPPGVNTAPSASPPPAAPSQGDQAHSAKIGLLSLILRPLQVVFAAVTPKLDDREKTPRAIAATFCVSLVWLFILCYFMLGGRKRWAAC